MAHISYSELKEWTNCAWKHKLTYLEKLKEFTGNEYTAFGTAVHTVCENLITGAKINAKELFQEEFLKNLQLLKEKNPDIQLRVDLVNDMRTQGEKITEYVLPAVKESFGAFELVSVEEKLYEPIADKDYDFKGFIDLVIKTKDNKYHIIDWKTCSWGWDSRQRTDKMITYQLTLYKHFWCEKHNVDPLEAETHFALLKRTAKNNIVEIFKVSSGTKKTNNALKLLNKAIYNIKKSNFVKNRLSCHGRYGVCDFYKTQHCK